jgi:hypothetical protein
MQRQTRETKSTAATDELTQLIVIYDKVCQTMLSCPLDVDLVDVYTLYDFASLLILFAISSPEIKECMHNGSFVTTSLNAIRLFECSGGVHNPPSCFFDSDKLYYDRTEITRAMTSAGCTEGQQELLWRNIIRLFKSFESEISIHTSSYGETDSYRGFIERETPSQEESVKGTEV